MNTEKLAVNTTLLFLLSHTDVVIGKHLIGPMKDKWGEPGGKLEADESVKACMCREVKDEIGVIVTEDSLVQAAHINFHIKGVGNNPKFSCAIFIAREWVDEPKKTKAMDPKWFPQNSPPYDEMMPGDVHWFKLVIEGWKFIGQLHYNDDCTEVLGWTYHRVKAF